MTRKTVDLTGDGDAEPVRYTVLSHRAIAMWAVLIIAAGVGMAVWLLLVYGTDDPRLQLEAIRTAGAVVVGAGGAAALLLAARRQRAAEIALKQKEHDQADAARAHALQERDAARAHALQERIATETRMHQERVATDAREDAAARRITELYTAAAAQLGSDKAPVRLAGIYALERLAQDNPTQRQTIVNVLCAYLRMPDTPSDDQSAAHAHTERVQEREVRLTAQRVLTAHLQPGDEDNPAHTFWADTDLDLTEAVLIGFDLHQCHVRTAQFTLARFAGDAFFAGAKFADDASFAGAKFADDEELGGNTSFAGAKFVGNASFAGAKFAGDASFAGAKFANDATFSVADFADFTSFKYAEFTDHVSFNDATFAAGVRFDEAMFTRGASFNHAKFTRASFDAAKFTREASFITAEFADDVSFHRVTFAGRVSFDEASFAGKAAFGRAGLSLDAPFRGDTSFKAVVFAREVPPEVRRFWSPPPGDAAAEPDPSI